MNSEEITLCSGNVNGGSIISFTWWHFLISSYYFTLWNEFSLTALKSEELTLCSGSFKYKIHLVTFLYIFLFVDCFKWALIDHKIHLVTFLYIFLLVDCFKWALIDHSEKWRVHCEFCKFQCGGVYCNIHLVTFLYIFLLVHCFKWALIDHIKKQRVHSELWQFQMGGYMGGYIIKFTWCHTDISWYLPISLLFQMSYHWLHWKVKSSLWALPVSNALASQSSFVSINRNKTPTIDLYIYEVISLTIGL